MHSKFVLIDFLIELLVVILLILLIISGGVFFSYKALEKEIFSTKYEILDYKYKKEIKKYNEILREAEDNK